MLLDGDLGYLTLNLLHILSAAVLIGGVAAFPLLRREAQRATDPAVARHNLHVLNRVGNLLLVPAIVLLFVTGMLMGAGPWARWNMFLPQGRWALVGMMMWAVLAAAVGYLVGVVKQMGPVADEEGMDGGRLRRLWVQYRWAVIATAVLAVATEAVMVYKPVI